MKTRYVVDTNVLVHWLLRPSGLAAKIINSSLLELFTPPEAIEELMNNAEEWTSRKTLPGFSLSLDVISQFIEVFDEPYPIEAKFLADKLLAGKDKKDVPFLALALTIGADIWSYDQHFDGIPHVSRVRSEDIRDRSFSELPELWQWRNQ